jgi:hypothetical protein
MTRKNSKMASTLAHLFNVELDANGMPVESSGSTTTGCAAVPKTIKWDSKGEDGVLLQTLLTNGSIAQEDSPKDVWERFPTFQKYNPVLFRSNMNNMKRQIGFHLRENVLAEGAMAHESR